MALVAFGMVRALGEPDVDGEDGGGPDGSPGGGDDSALVAAPDRSVLGSDAPPVPPSAFGAPPPVDLS
jgi:hypothetical protein